MVRIGILGAAAIAPAAMIDPARVIDGVEVTAVAARDRTRAERFAERHGIGTVEADYRALCRSDEIDAVYVALPASHHHRWSIEALRAGKDVLCEKPIALNAVEAAEMVAEAERTERILMEAFHWRYHPLAARMKELVDQRIGTLQSLSAIFTVPIADRSNIRYQLELGGGAMMDLGCYPMQWIRYLLPAEPTLVSATATEDPPGVDVSLTAQLTGDPTSGDPVAVEIHCSMAPDGEFAATLTAIGSEGRLEVSNPLVPQRGNRLELITAAGVESEQIRSPSTYHHQLVAFLDAVHTRQPPPTSGADSIASMAAIDDCYRVAGMLPRGLTA